MILKVLALLNLLISTLFHDCGLQKRDKSHLKDNRKDCAYCGFPESVCFFFLKSHRIQINSSKNSFRFGFITCNSKRCMESLR